MLPGMADLDPDQSGGQRLVEQPGDLEPADLQLVGDLDLGPSVDVVPPGHRRREDELRRAGGQLGSIHGGSLRCVLDQGPRRNLRRGPVGAMAFPGQLLTGGPSSG